MEQQTVSSLINQINSPDEGQTCNYSGSFTNGGVYEILFQAIATNPDWDESDDCATVSDPYPVTVTVVDLEITEPDENDVFLHGDKVKFKAEVTPSVSVDSWAWTVESGDATPNSSTTDTYEPVVQTQNTDYENPEVFKVKVTATIGSSKFSCERSIKVVYPKITSITFDNFNRDLDGETRIQILHEKDLSDYHPEWTESQTGKSVAGFVRGTKMHLTATFATKLALTNPTKIKLQANMAYNSNWDFVSTDEEQTVNDDSTEIGMEGIQNLSNEIYHLQQGSYAWKYYTKANDHPYTILPKEADNKHDIYVTLGMPVTMRYGGDDHTIYETVLYKTCIAAKGDNNEQSALNHIWRLFSGRDFTRKDAVPLTYYNSFLCPTTTTLDLLQNTDGQCGAWAHLFLDCLKHHGLNYNNNYTQFFADPLTTGAGRFLVKNWRFQGSGHSGDANFPYRNLVKDCDDWETYTGDTTYLWLGGVADVTDRPGVPGQNNGNPASFFGNHQVVSINGKIYDPSYGAIYANLQQEHDQALAGLIKSSSLLIKEAEVGVDLNGNGNKTDELLENAFLIKKCKTGAAELVFDLYTY